MTCNSEMGIDLVSCSLGIKHGQTFETEIGVLAVIIFAGCLLYYLLMFGPASRIDGRE